MIFTKIKYVWDRHHRANERADKTGSIELRITVGKLRKYIATGISVTESEWDDNSQSIVGILDARVLNLSLERLRVKVREILSEMEKEEMIDLDAIPRLLQAKSVNMSFLDYCAKRIYDRQKIKADGTIRRYEVWLGKMQEWGKIKSFSDCTQANINKMDEWLHGKGFKDETIYGYHKHLRMFINDAIVDGLIQENPYSAKRIKVKRGAPNIHCYVTEEELQKIMDVELDSECMKKVRDLFVFQAHTGMAYIDMTEFDFTKAEKYGDIYVLNGRRQKTDVPYHFILLDEAVRILEKYDWELPYMSNQKYNTYIKVLVEKCGIRKPVASHWARRTAGMVMLNNGVPIGVVSRILGHTSVHTTEKAYAFLFNKTIDEEMIKFQNVMRKKRGER